MANRLRVVQKPPTHLVLARKWRPRDFESLVGQETVVKALRHALDTQRLHHAYLLTGTRGVGKTTIARIIAKALNCETGITSRPCGRCDACLGIDAGRYPDYVEMDAASNRKVEEMAAVLESAAYAPGTGRFKVFVIDEVHMLTNHAFNAMLKTLEEPPAHVVFVLATTDPQKVPVTVLSRCMQFGLRNMATEAVSAHLAQVLQAEGIAFEGAALGLIAGAAGGSMRDALSLLDQAIAVGAGSVHEADVRAMLGSVDDALVGRLLDLLADAVHGVAASAGAGPAPAVALIDLADRMAEENAPFAQILLAIAQRLQRIAVLQVRQAQAGRQAAGAAAPASTGASTGASGAGTTAAQRLAGRLDPADVQVWYQVAIHGARDLALAPDPHTGFVMALVRMLAFVTEDGLGAGRPQRPQPSAERGRPVAERAAAAPAERPASRSTPPQAAAAEPGSRPPPPVREAGPAVDVAAPAARDAGPPARDADPPARDAGPTAQEPDFDGDWAALTARLPAGGMAREFLRQSELVERVGRRFRVRVPIKPLAQPQIVGRVADALNQWFGMTVQLDVEVGDTGQATAAAQASRERDERQAQARTSIDRDPFVRELIDGFGATIVPDSIKPLDGEQR